VAKRNHFLTSVIEGGLLFVKGEQRAWKQLLTNNEVTPHSTSKSELAGIRTVIARDLADASIRSVSTDRRFATAYNAACKLRKWPSPLRAIA